MGLMTSVLRNCVVDLLFFGIVFVISLLAFSMMLWVQLGPVMEDFYDQIPAAISLFRALYGDFDVDEIMNNSSGYLNAMLFLAYLFVAIFIMLSMFLAILAESQATVRENQAIEKQNPKFNEYGVLASCYKYINKGFHVLTDPMLKKKGDGDDEDDAEDGAEDGGDGGDEKGVAASVSELRSEVGAISHAVRHLHASLEQMRGGRGNFGAGQLLAESSSAVGIDEARAMRKVVEALDLKLTRKLAAIDERLMVKGKSAPGRSGTRSRPGPGVPGYTSAGNRDPPSPNGPMALGRGGSITDSGGHSGDRDRRLREQPNSRGPSRGATMQNGPQVGQRRASAPPPGGSGAGAVGYDMSC